MGRIRVLHLQIQYIRPVIHAVHAAKSLHFPAALQNKNTIEGVPIKCSVLLYYTGITSTNTKVTVDYNKRLAYYHKAFLGDVPKHYTCTMYAK